MYLNESLMVITFLIIKNIIIIFVNNIVTVICICLRSQSQD